MRSTYNDEYKFVKVVLTPRENRPGRNGTAMSRERAAKVLKLEYRDVLRHHCRELPTGGYVAYFSSRRTYRRREASFLPLLPDEM